MGRRNLYLMKYYLGKNLEDEYLVWKIEIYKLYDNGDGEKIRYSRSPNGNFILSRVRYHQIKLPRGLREISELEYEVIDQEGFKVADAYHRLLSYFDDEKSQIMSIPKNTTYETTRVAKKLGWKIKLLNVNEYPGPLLNSIPWIKNGTIIISPECIRYLEELKKIYKHQSDLWIKDGIDKLLECIKS